MNYLSKFPEDPKSIPELCKLFNINDEFKIMKIVAELQEIKKVEFVDFDKIYREDGGAIYLARYKKCHILK